MTDFESDDQQDGLDSSHVGQQAMDLTAETNQSTIHQYGDEPHHFHNVLWDEKASNYTKTILIPT